jgi:hypothetical protein
MAFGFGSLACVMTLLGGSGSQGQQQPAIPNEARRRIAQAMWPENLFDSTGRSEGRFIRRAFQPAYADLEIRPAAAPVGLPDVSLFVGTAYPSGCSHCGTRTYVVAQRGAEFISLLSPEDIQYLAPWATPEALGDSVALRTFVISVLRATCFLGCEVRQVHRRSEIPDADSPFLRRADGQEGAWQLPRTYAWQRNGGVLVDIALLAPGYGIYAVRASYEGRDRLRVSISAAAHFVMS